jgi:5-methylcytosine-specific restriction enzyme A
MMVKLRTATLGLTSVRTSSLRVAPKAADAHYQSPEHKAFAKAVLKRDGYRCQWAGCDVVGVFNPLTRRSEPRMIADHIIEIKDGGDWSMANGQCLCVKHNTIKGIRARAARL